MSEKRKEELLHDHNHDGINRRGFLKCMAWAGTGASCVMSKVRDTDEKFSFPFSKAGTYPYFCSIHPKTTGKVIVQ